MPSEARRPPVSRRSYFFLCLSARKRFLRLWVAIFDRLRFLPLGTSVSLGLVFFLYSVFQMI